jgi:hypothetical protein
LKLRSISQSVTLTSKVLKINSAFIAVELINTKLQLGYELVVKPVLYLTHLQFFLLQVNTLNLVAQVIARRHHLAVSTRRSYGN